MKAFSEGLAIALLDSKHKTQKSPIALRDGSSGQSQSRRVRVSSEKLHKCVCVPPAHLL